MARYRQYHTRCTACGGKTTHVHARQHDGLCAHCADPEVQLQASDDAANAAIEAAEHRQAMLIDHGPALLREEGYYGE